ncbi:metallophosphoesterase family protein [Limimaricola soesokkakensis]|nr:metallophosphoesterase [Limimaricola soesokkakensis]
MPTVCRILQIGDLHLPDWQEKEVALDVKDGAFSKKITRDLRPARIRNILKRIHELSTSGDVDCIAVMGDLTSMGKQEYISPAIEILDSLTRDISGKRPPIVCVPGNHDVNKDEALRLGKNGKFSKLANEAQSVDWVTIPIDEVVRHRIGGTENGIDAILCNSSVGSWSPHMLPQGLAEKFETTELELPPIAASASEDYAVGEANVEGEAESRSEQLFQQLDTPYFSRRTLETLADSFSDSESTSCILIAHHNILPQRTPRILAYGEMLNAGHVRQFLMESERNIVYLHGHIHEDPIEVISSPAPGSSGFAKATIVSISAPKIEDGFNEVTVFLTDANEIYLVRVAKFRPNSSNAVGNYSDQEVTYIPMGMNPAELLSSATRKLWQIVREMKRVNWHELNERPEISGMPEADIEESLMRLFCARMVRIDQLGRSKTKWSIEAMADVN